MGAHKSWLRYKALYSNDMANDYAWARYCKSDEWVMHAVAICLDSPSLNQLKHERPRCKQ